jgi:hypothetical protein
MAQEPQTDPPGDPRMYTLLHDLGHLSFQDRSTAELEAEGWRKVEDFDWGDVLFDTGNGLVKFGNFGPERVPVESIPEISGGDEHEVRPAPANPTLWHFAYLMGGGWVGDHLFGVPLGHDLAALLGGGVGVVCGYFAYDRWGR